MSNWPSPINSRLIKSLISKIAARTRKPEKAADYLHSALIKMAEYQTRDVVKDPVSFLVKTAVNADIDAHRRENVRAEVPINVHDLHHIPDNSPLQLEKLITQKRLERLQQGLNQLPARTSSIFLMHRMDGLKYREIAELMDISVSAVEKHIAKALFMLSDWMDGW